MFNNASILTNLGNFQKSSEAIATWQSNGLKFDDVYENTEEYNLNKEDKILIELDEMIDDMLRNKKLHPNVTEKQKTKHLSCFCYTIFSSWTKKYCSKLYTQFYYENQATKLILRKELFLGY